MSNSTQSKKVQQLNIKQKKAIELLLEGKTNTEVASAVGVGRDTLWEWRNKSYFADALNEQWQQLQDNSAEQLRSLLVPQALDVVEQALDRANVLNNADVKLALATLKALVPYGSIKLPVANTDCQKVVLELPKRWGNSSYHQKLSEADVTKACPHSPAS